MAARRFARPTEAELEILTVLWAQGSATVREVNRIMNASKEVGYTTTLKLMQIMTGKGLLIRDEQQRPQVYTSAQSEEAMQTALTDDLVDRVFRGSAQRLVMRALNARKASPEEIQAIRDLLDEYEGDKS